ncbi:MAG: hypothetical protein KF841_16140 [Phycisphaerae bacterium]|nr:hypothetical protein [Phycisphaerae bacterium]
MANNSLLKHSLSLASTLLPCLLNVTSAEPPDSPPAAPIVEIVPIEFYQSAFAALTNATDRDALEGQVRQMIAADPDRRQIIEQVVWFAAQDQTDPLRRVLVGRILKVVDLPTEQLVRILVPHLDNRVSSVIERVRDILLSCEDHSSTRPPDFSPYRAIIEEDVRANREPSRSLIRHMYRSDPSVALLTLIRAYQLRDPEEIKPILWAEHTIADLMWKRRYGFVDRRGGDPAVTAELDKLARHDRWWVRLYAAEIIAANPELATASTRARLETDTQVLVKQAVGRAPADPAQRGDDQ